MILHSVFLSLAPDADMDELADVMAGLADLQDEIDGWIAFDHGPNIDAEGKSPEAPYGFLATFSDAACLARYAVDPRHQALGARLVDLCNGAEQIKVYDIDAVGQ